MNDNDAFFLIVSCTVLSGDPREPWFRKIARGAVSETTLQRMAECDTHIRNVRPSLIYGDDYGAARPCCISCR